MTQSQPSSTQSEPWPTAAAFLSERYPPLQTYWPNLPRVSAPQAAFLCLDQLEALYGGAAGGGKSDALLAGALQYVDTPGYAALILRRTFKQLSLPGAIMARSKEWLKPHREVRWSDDEKTWTFPSGATLTFGYLDTADDIYRYQGPAFQYVAFDELTQFNEAQYTYLFSRLRGPAIMCEFCGDALPCEAHPEAQPHRDTPALAFVPLRGRSASNPGGVGHAWVKQRFPIAADDAPSEKGGRIFVPAKVADNPGLDKAKYALSLANLSDVLQAQLLAGDWGAFEGAAFTITDDHLVNAFPLEDAHDRFEACDYGLNGAPWSLVPIDFEGNLVFFDMLYEHDLLPSDVAELVIEKRKAGWGISHSAFADPSIWHRTGARNKWGAPAMLADEFTDHGVPLIPANNDPRAGLIRLRELLELDPKHPFPNWHDRAGEMHAPRLFFVRGGCPRLIDEMRAAPLQPIDKPDGGEKIDPTWESRYGHAVAMARYAVMTRPAPSAKPYEPLDDPRAEFLRRYDEQRAKTGSPVYQWT